MARKPAKPKRNRGQEIKTPLYEEGIQLEPAFPKRLLLMDVVQRVWATMFLWDGFQLRRARSNYRGELVTVSTDLREYSRLIVDDETILAEPHNVQRSDLAYELRVIAPCFFKVKVFDEDNALILTAIPDHSVMNGLTRDEWYSLSLRVSFADLAIEWFPAPAQTETNATVAIYR